MPPKKKCYEQKYNVKWTKEKKDKAMALFQLDGPHLCLLQTDGASVMMSKNNSVMTLLKKEIPDIFVLTRVCHSFHLCTSYACAKFTCMIEDIVRDVYNYISFSPKWVDVFQKFQRLLELKPHKPLHPTQTRWLSVHAAVARVLEQYDALTAYFAAAASTERLLVPATVHERLVDPVNKLILEFVDFILPSFTNLN
ncbi:uncharacterized protein LOC121836612 [Ixodes scapularis]|uniref:uncharacterized protein LOC121836612 n=1 Tax=Ixodes scapularis TaxID=6945 RepID=UPI001A9EFE75|nr:uncharacterized protein LOC121836612 [Ixodes scapularis]